MPTGTSLVMTAKVKDKASRELKGIRGQLGKLRSSIKAVGVAGAAVAAVGGAAFIAFSIKAIKASAKQETINRRLAKSLANIGINYKAVEGEINKFAAAQQATTEFGDDQTKAVLTTLIQLTSDYETSLASIAGVQDFATANSMSLESASRLVGRALGGNVSVLARYVPDLQGLKKETFNALKPMERQAVVLDAIAKKFGGAAKAIDPTAQKIKNLSNTFGDLVEAIGKALKETGAFDEVAAGLITLMSDLEKTVKDNADVIGEAFVGAAIFAIEVIRFMSKAVGGLILSFKLVRAIAVPALKVIGVVAQAQATGGLSLLTGGFKEFEEASMELGQALEGVEVDITNTADAFAGWDKTLEKLEDRLGKFKSKTQEIQEIRPPTGVTPTAPGGAAAPEVPVLEFGTGFEEAGQQATKLQAALRSLALDMTVLGGNSSKLHLENLSPLNDQLKSIQETLDQGITPEPEVFEEVSAMLQASGEDWDDYIEKNRMAQEATQSFAAATKTMSQKVRADLKGVLLNSKQMSKAIVAGLTAVIKGEKSFGEAMKAMAASVLSSISEQAKIKALFELAEALGAAASQNYAKAGQHLLAAAAYGLISGAAAAGAAAIGGGGGGRRGRADRPGPTIAEDQQAREIDRGERAAPTRTTININARFEGQSMITQAEVGQAIHASLVEAEREGMIPRDSL